MPKAVRELRSSTESQKRVGGQDGGGCGRGAEGRREAVGAREAREGRRTREIKEGRRTHAPTERGRNARDGWMVDRGVAVASCGARVGARRRDGVAPRETDGWTVDVRVKEKAVDRLGLQ